MNKEFILFKYYLENSIGASKADNHLWFLSGECFLCFVFFARTFSIMNFHSTLYFPINSNKGQKGLISQTFTNQIPFVRFIQYNFECYFHLFIMLDNLPLEDFWTMDVHLCHLQRSMTTIRISWKLNTLGSNLKRGSSLEFTCWSRNLFAIMLQSCELPNPKNL